MVDEDADSPALPMPIEADRRIVEDADSRGCPVLLNGSETWWISPLPLSPRGEKLGQLIDEMQRVDVELAAAQKIVQIVSMRLEEATTEEQVAKAQQAVLSACEKRQSVIVRLEGIQSEIAFHALRTHYRLGRNEVRLLVSQKHWSEILAALSGSDTMESKIQLAFETLKRVKEITDKEGDGSRPAPPFGSAPSSGGPAPSSSRMASSPT